GDLLQHVVVERPEHAAAGFQLVREAGAGRCGFLIAGAAKSTPQVITRPADGWGAGVPDGVVALSSVLRVNGPFADAIRQTIGDAWIAPSYSSASHASLAAPFPVATVEGDLFRGPHLVSGGGSAEARGILETKREIKELRDRIASDRDALLRLSREAA